MSVTEEVAVKNKTSIAVPEVIILLFGVGLGLVGAFGLAPFFQSKSAVPSTNLVAEEKSLFVLEELPGWPIDTGECPSKTTGPVFVDLDGDSDKEIVYTERLSVNTSCDVVRMRAWHHNGSEVAGWEGGDNFALQIASGVRTYPVVGDIDGDGLPEVVVRTENYHMHAFNHDGSLVSGWGIQNPLFGNDDDELYLSVGDIDNNGTDEVAMVSYNGIISVLDGSGQFLSGWPKCLYYDALEQCVGFPSHTSGVSLFDFDGDGDLEIFTVSNGQQSSYQFPATLFAFHQDGTPLQGFPIVIGYDDDTCHETIDIMPALARDPTTDEVIIATICDGYFEGERSTFAAMRHMDGSYYPGWPQAQPSDYLGTNAIADSDPVLADLEGDGSYELIFGSATNTGVPAHLYAYHSDGQPVEGFPRLLSDDPTAGLESGAAVIDLDDDGLKEIVIGVTGAIAGRDAVYFITPNGQDFLPPQEVPENYSINYGSPLITDLDGDTNPDVVLAVSRGLSSEALYGWTLPFTLHDTSLWPNHRRDLQRTGTFPLANTNTNSGGSGGSPALLKTQPVEEGLGIPK